MSDSIGSLGRRVGRSESYKWRVSDELWGCVGSLLVDPPRRSRFPGRKRYCPRLCLEGVLYILFTGTPWLEMPSRELGLPSGETCRRRLEEWASRGVLSEAIVVLQERLADTNNLDFSRVIVDASLVDAKKGVIRSGVLSEVYQAAVSI
jgi:transposase